MATFLGLNADELQLFLDEMAEHLDTLETDLLDLERLGADPERIGRIFRAAHTIKGTAATVGLEGLARLTHAMETLFDRVRAGELAVTPEVMAPLLAAVDLLREMLAALVAETMPPDPPAALLDELIRAAAGETGAGAATASPAGAPALAGNTGGGIVIQVRFAAGCVMPAVRALQVLLALEGLGQVVGSEPSQAAIEAEKVGERLTVWLGSQPDEAAVRATLAGIPDLAEVKVQAAQPQTAQAASGEQAQGGEGPGRAGGSDRTIRVDVAVLDQLMNLVGELVIDRSRIAGMGQMLAGREGAQDVAEELGRVTAHLARVTGTLQETVLKARMLPIERVFRKFPRMVRDLSRQLGKQVEFLMAGEETELDRSLIEVIGDPLTHLLRNALDHGLEPAEERRKRGKPEVGVLRLMASHEENHVVIRVQDDGRGIDPDKVRASAIRKGLISADRARELNEYETIQLLFAPGFSTAEQVTDVSGRGVGLDVVRRNIERVGGRIELENRLGQGTTFRLLLPLTLATIRALLVQIGDDTTLALPLSGVAESLRVAPESVTSIRGRWVTRVRDRVVPLLWIKQFMDPAACPDRPDQPVLAVLISHKGEYIGLVVDRLLGEQEVVVKGLGEFFGQVKGVSGVTILGDGSLALILDVGAIVGVLAHELARGSEP